MSETGGPIVHRQAVDYVICLNAHCLVPKQKPLCNLFCGVELLKVQLQDCASSIPISMQEQKGPGPNNNYYWPSCGPTSALTSLQGVALFAR